MVSYRLVAFVFASAFLLSACGGGSSTAESSTVPPVTASAAASAPASASAEAAAPSPSATPEETQAAEAIDEMCALLVAPEAPAPPEQLPADDVPGLNEAWGEFFVQSLSYWDSIEGDMESLSDSAPGDQAKAASDSYSGFLGMKVAAALGQLVVTINDSFKAEDLEDAVSDFQTTSDETCPQWQGQEWPWEGQRVEVTAPAEKPAALEYQKLTSREWAKIAKNPDAFIGDAILVYGVITQFDSATGTDTFRADVSNMREGDWYEYDTNTILTGSESRLSDFVEDDIFVTKAIVQGSYSYETTMGGELTVPVLEVKGIKRLGSAD